MKVLVVCVCYNNFSDVEKYVDSLLLSTNKVDSKHCISVVVVNNGDKFPIELSERLKSLDGISVDVVDGHGNVGYFPGCFIGLKYAQKTDFFDVLVVSNVDLTVDESFVDVLLSESLSKSGFRILAPSILSMQENKDRNPKILKRPKFLAMLKYVVLYLIPYFHFAYRKTFYKNKKTPKFDDGGLIYAPHGSMIVFVGGFEQWEILLDYPVFLFGEEIFIGEICRKNSVPIIYKKGLRVFDSDHASTGLQSESFLRKNNLKAIFYLLNRFWVR